MPRVTTGRDAFSVSKLVLALAIAATTVAWLQPPVRAAAQSEEPAFLGATTIVRASQPGAMPVHIPYNTSVFREDDGAPAIEIEGDGRFVGVVLVSDDRRFRMLLGGMSFCGSAGCTPESERTPISIRSFLEAGSDIEIPAGDYMLYAITDGAPATIRIGLRDLAGTADLSPDQTVNLRFRQPTVHLDVHEPGAPTLYESQDPIDLTGFGGLSFQIHRVHAEDWVLGRSGTCIYRGNPPTTSVVPFVPGCLLGFSVGATDAFVTPYAHVRDLLSLTTFFGDGRWTVGKYIQGGGRIDRIESLAFDLDFDDEFFE